MIETRVVEEARVRADVKSAHIRALKARLREKKNCCQGRFRQRRGGKRREVNKKLGSDGRYQGAHGDRTYGTNQYLDHFIRRRESKGSRDSGGP